jgi:kynurenine formamidase
MGRGERYGTFAKSWAPPTYTVDDDGKVVGGYRPSGASNWGRWGPDDRRGTANLTGETEVLRAAQLVRRGAVFSLTLPIDATAPRWPDRQPHKHYFSMTGSDQIVGSPLNENFEGFIWNDDAIDMSLQGSTQWDGLGHVGVQDALYNGFWSGNITALGGDSVLGIGHMRESFVGRGILLDLARHMKIDALAPGYVITPDLLAECASAQGVAVESGDIVILRTGHQPKWWGLTTEAERAEYWSSWPGVGIDAAHWRAERDVAAVTCDTVGFEVMPPETEIPYPVHQFLLVDIGMTIGEMWELEALAADCAQDGVYAFLLVAPPLNVTRAVGSPVNPIAIK